MRGNWTGRKIGRRDRILDSDPSAALDAREFRRVRSARALHRAPLSSTNMSHHHHTETPKKKLHQDWRFIVAVVLMLISMIVYVMTLDEAVVPAEQPANTPVAPITNP
jgi:hypothetical protein